MDLTDASASPQILPAVWRDLREAVDLERACFGDEAWPWMDVLAALTFPDTVRLKVVQQGRMVALSFGERRRWENVGWVASIGVHPTLRRRGLGRRLLAATEHALATPVIRLTLRPSNGGALALYRSAGYVEIDRLERYYRNGEGAIVMEKVCRRPAAGAGPPPLTPPPASLDRRDSAMKPGGLLRLA